MVLVDTHRAADIQVADTRRVVDIHQVAAHILVVGYYKDPLVEVVMAERSHHIDLADSGLDPG